MSNLDDTRIGDAIRRAAAKTTVSFERLQGEIERACGPLHMLTKEMLTSEVFVALLILSELHPSCTDDRWLQGWLTATPPCPLCGKYARSQARHLRRHHGRRP